MVDQPVKYVVEEINSTYMSYLAQLEERNRQKQIIHKKSEEILRRERLEQGFQLYFNILNANHNVHQKVKQANVHINQNRSRSANLTDRHGAERTKSAPNLTKQRRTRRAWGEFNGFESRPSRKSISKSNTTFIQPLGEPVGDRFPYPSTRNMHCRQRKGQNDSTAEEIICVDKDESPIPDVKQTCADPVEMIEIFGLQLDIFSNWGDKNWVGLSGLELGDNDDLTKILQFEVVEVLKINSDGVSTSPVQLLHPENLFKEPFQTSDPTNMCFTSADHLPLRINIRCLMNSDDRIDQNSIILRLWNYNDPKYPGIGIKDCMIKLKSNGHTHVLFNGVLDKISESKSTDFPKVLDFNLRDNKSVSSTTALATDSPEMTTGQPIPTTRDSLDRIWLDSGEMKNWRYLRKVDPSLNDNDEELAFFFPSARHQLKTTTDNSRMRSLLEESWNSLKFFNHFHAGRISLEKENSVKHSALVQRDSGLWSGEMVGDLYNSTKPVRDDDCVAKPESKVALEEVKCMSTLDQPNTYLAKKDESEKIVCPPRFSEPITIPVLPFGHNLVIDIISTWGDIYYVGLTGIEIFTMDGTNVAPFCKIQADPADINILPGYRDDPRVITNLLDGVNWTRDDIHMWLAPFSTGARHLIQISLPSWTKPIALLRIWNYNKSRVHASRGAREILIYLDSNPIFRGEISKALGLEFGELENFSETILFCTDNDILEKIGKNDEVLKVRNSLSSDVESVTCHSDERPKTSVQPNVDDKSPELLNPSGLITKLLDGLELNDKESSRELWIEIELLKPWNENASFIGLTGIQILDSNMEQVRVNRLTINGKAVLPEDPVYRLIDENFHTCNPNDMWCSLYIDGKPLKLRIYVAFNASTRDLDFGGLRIWNYNNPHIETDYSCKLIRIRDCQDRIWTQNSSGLDIILLRRGPGHTRFAFGQTIQLDKNITVQTLPNSLSESQIQCDLPSGFVYQLNLFSSWYDQFYVGLDGLELIGRDGLPIRVGKNQIFASPSSVNDLNTYPNRSDIRTVDKLIDGINQGLEMNYHCWLAPILPNRINQIFIVFDEPVHAIGLKLWNYTRTPERGVREFSVLVDDRLLFRGYLPKCQRKANHDLRCAGRIIQGILPNCEQRHENDGCNQYYVVPLNQEDVEKFEDSRFILDNSKTYVPEDQVRLINIDSLKSSDWLGTTESHLRLRSNINQTLRPSTCISNQPLIPTL